jgi:hypothetical protein
MSFNCTWPACGCDPLGVDSPVCRADHANGLVEMEGRTARNIRVQGRYDALMTEGKHGHYETMFRIVREEVEAAQLDAYAEGRKDESESAAWQPIDTAPEDKNILVATHGGWVDTAFWTDEDGEGRKWWWLISAKEYAKHPIHSSLMPTHWMPLLKHPTA